MVVIYVVAADAFQVPSRKKKSDVLRRPVRTRRQAWQFLVGHMIAGLMVLVAGMIPSPGGRPWLLEAWPDVPTRDLPYRDDRFFLADFMRRVARERLGITPDEIDASH